MPSALRSVSSGAGRERHVASSLFNQQIPEIRKDLIPLVPHRTRNRTSRVDKDDEVVMPDTAAHLDHGGVELLTPNARAIHRRVPLHPANLRPTSQRPPARATAER